MLVGFGDMTMVEGTAVEVLPEENVIATDSRALDEGERTTIPLSSWNPELDVDGRTARLMMDLLPDLLGKE
jgi:hypothetical protein